MSAIRNTSTTTTVIDNKNGSVPKSPGKVLKRTVTEDIVTTFSSPAAWLLVIALIITWSAVAIVMFDLVDYKNFSEMHKEKAEKQEKPEKKIQTKATQKEKLEKKEKAETKTKEDKKVKTKEKAEEKTKKEMKVGKQEKGKLAAAKVKETAKTTPKARERDEKESPAVPEHGQKDQYAFCRYMIDMFVHGDLKPGTPNNSYCCLF
ncbi:Trdn [Phodopus roborovskii]|uniref:Triadin n=1 Tax=Phodopus roborovskii TaxID=109678 RepID=A0AAU9YUT7_PHORO|nr:Trdn [Phodopus roborovskii]